MSSLFLHIKGERSLSRMSDIDVTEELKAKYFYRPNKYDMSWVLEISEEPDGSVMELSQDREVALKEVESYAASFIKTPYEVVFA